MAESTRKSLTVSRRIQHAVPARVLVAFSLGLAALFPLSAQALVVATLPGTNVAPTGVGNDPGWAEVTQSGSNYVYLGDGWILSARHVGVFSATFSTGTFAPIPNQNFVLNNPASSGLTDSQGNLTTDLRLIRINGDPGLPSMFGPNPAFTIPTQEPTVGNSVTFIGVGSTRDSTTTSWDANGNEVPPSVNPVAFTGYKTIGDSTKRWGMNNISNPSVLNSPIINGVAAAISLTTGDGITRKVVSLATTFDQSAGSYEAQAVSGDSGSSVFRKNSITQKWELAGIVNSIYVYNNQPALTAAYGDLTTFADLAYYHDQIFSVINANPDYSIMGDINLDGVVSGDGTGPAATDDVTAFIQGWGYQQAKGDINSWKKGDFNQDGKVDVNDFLLLRSAFNASGSGASLNFAAAQLGVGSGEVPEPSSLLLAAIGAGLLTLCFRRHKSRPRNVTAAG